MYQFLFNELRTRANTVIDCHINNDHSKEDKKESIRVLNYFIEALDVVLPVDEGE